MFSIPCYIVEEHQMVVEPLFQLIRQKKLSYEGLFMVNLDSHSDVSVPKELSVAEDGFLERREVLDKVDIESWIIPLYYMDVLKSVCWIYPDWTKHSFKEEVHFRVGKTINGFEIKVTSPSNYSISEDDYEHESQLSNLHNASLFVQSLSSQNQNDFFYLSQLIKKLKTQLSIHSDFILSIDLDFFSTHDPFISLFSEKEYFLLRKIYSFSPPESDSFDKITYSVEARRSQLKALKRFFTDVQNNHRKINYKDAGSDLQELVESLLERHAGDYDWEWLHEMGRGIDDSPAPHHPSSQIQIDTLMQNVNTLLSQLPFPKAIFVSRSSEDDFCPKSQVEQIQEQLLSTLRRLYHQIDVISLY